MKIDNKKRSSRYFSLITYCKGSEIRDILTSHSSSIRAFAFIFHDRDDAVAHYHLVLRTFSTWSPASILKWFSHLKNEKGEKINTFCEVVSSISSMIPYLLHETEESINDGKYRYSRSDLIFQNLEDLTESKVSFDSSYDIVKDLILCTPALTMVRKYGREYIYHISQYELITEKILKECGNNKAVREFVDNNMEDWSTDDELPF